VTKRIERRFDTRLPVGETSLTEYRTSAVGDDGALLYTKWTKRYADQREFLVRFESDGRIRWTRRAVTDHMGIAGTERGAVGTSVEDGDIVLTAYEEDDGQTLDGLLALMAVGLGAAGVATAQGGESSDE